MEVSGRSAVVSPLFAKSRKIAKYRISGFFKGCAPKTSLENREAKSIEQSLRQDDLPSIFRKNPNLPARSDNLGKSKTI
jgi:hypothetical protein